MMESRNNIPQPIKAPLPVTPQKSYPIAQEAGISWGRYNINTDAITSYYKGLSNLLGNGMDLWSNLRKLQVEKLKWDQEHMKKKEVAEEEAEKILMERLQHFFGETLSYEYRRND